MKYAIALIFFFWHLCAFATIKIAVASNFKVTLSDIVSRYQQQSTQKIVISSGSTGILYQQIKQGAPFDLFLSADSERAALVEDSRYGLVGSRFTYAEGVLAFWYPDAVTQVNKQTLLQLRGRVAIANPQLAPYGLATQQALQYLNLWQHFSYIQGNNISQTFQFIDTGNINAGFVAHSLLLQANKENYYLLPPQSYQPILQQAVLLKRAKDNIEVQHFVTFLQSEPIKALIRNHGYR